jgi:hypothetical protein
MPDTFTAKDLHDLGLFLLEYAETDEDYSCLLPDDRRSVLVTALELGERALTLPEGFAIVMARWNSLGDLATSTQHRLGGVLANAVARAERLGVTTWEDFDPLVAGKFVHSPTTEGTKASTSTQHLRRSALRIAFSTLRELALASGDPTLDLKLPPRSQLAARATTDDEIVLLRMHAATDRHSRQPIALALSEASATTSETPRLTVLDLVDPDAPQLVRLPGTNTVKQRLGQLTEWGCRVMANEVRRRREAGISDSLPLVYAGALADSPSPQASTCVAIRSILRRSGLSNEPDLHPRSIIYWAGKQAFDNAETDKIEAAARAMGISSLDRAAQRIDYSWDTES